MQFPWLESENYQNKEDFIEQQAVKDHNLITANGTAPIESTDLILQAVHFETEEIRQKRFVYTNLDTMITMKSTEILSPNHSLQLDTLINVVTSNLTMIACHTLYGICQRTYILFIFIYKISLIHKFIYPAKLFLLFFYLYKN